VFSVCGTDGFVPRDDRTGVGEGSVYVSEQFSASSVSAAQGWAGLSQEQREEAKQLFNRYGTAEGLRRLREMDPDGAAQFKRERREPPVRSEPDDKSSTQ